MPINVNFNSNIIMEEKRYTLEEANQHFAIAYNNNIWKLLAKSERNEAENNQLINLAHASLLHWSESPKCTVVNLQRGEFMIAMVYTYVGKKDAAVDYAKRCLKLTEDHKGQMKDFDIAYAYLAMSRALALSGATEAAKEYLKMTTVAGETIKGEQDKKIFMDDLNSGPWYGLK